MTAFGNAFGASSAFGAASTPAFGASPGQAFGAASTPAFGAAPAAPAFGAASTPAFGATPTSTFGASPAFGAAGASTPAFGGTPAFGSASTPSIFGAASAPASSASMFGGSTFGVSAAAQPGSLFGAAPAASPTPSLFGTGTPGFLGSTPPPQMAPSVFGGGAPPGAAVGGSEAAVRELQAIEEAYRTGSPHGAFTHFFLNVVHDPKLRGRPPNVDSHKWREAMKQAGGENNIDSLWPVQATGFGHLLERRGAQLQAMKENEERMAALRAAVRHIARKHEIDIQERKDGIIRRHQELCHRLLHVMRAVDGAEGRLAASMGHYSNQNANLGPQKARIAALEGAVAPSSAGGLQRQVEAFASASRLMAGGAAMDVTSAQSELEEESMRQMHSILLRHVEAVRKLQEILARSQRDMEILCKVEGS